MVGLVSKMNETISIAILSLFGVITLIGMLYSSATLWTHDINQESKAVMKVARRHSSYWMLLALVVALLMGYHIYYFGQLK
jgi:hypothetical protein